MIKESKVIEYGDFQTPIDLALRTSTLVSNIFSKVNTIIDPTCGVGNFLKAFVEVNNTVKNVIGWEINPVYVSKARSKLNSFNKKVKIYIKIQNFFLIDWFKIIERCETPILFIGNPPWVTNEKLSKIIGKNLPIKSNFYEHKGIGAITGKSNFDISEWMILKIAEFISNRKSSLAFLIKTSVARKVLLYIYKYKLNIGNIRLYGLDSKKYFNTSVDACLFYAEGIHCLSLNYTCSIYKSYDSINPDKTMGIIKGKLISDIQNYSRYGKIDSKSELKWRSGVKHDCSKVMEFTITEKGFINGLNEIVDIPTDFLYPMYKSSDIAKEDLLLPSKFMLVTQKKLGDNTSHIKKLSPDTWVYLESHQNKLDLRKSSIYKKASRFAVFGVGEYTFKPWKVSISGLYKDFTFKLVGSYNNKPIIFDDTCYFLSFDNEGDAKFIFTLLTSCIARQFIESIIFKDSKRLITSTLLNRINLSKISDYLGVREEFNNRFFNYSYANELFM